MNHVFVWNFENIMGVAIFSCIAIFAVIVFIGNLFDKAKAKLRSLWNWIK